jgi:hypothetical protein
MRISSDSSSPDYRSDYMGAAVYLNGQLLERVMAADDIAGEVTLASLNELGNVYLVDGDRIATEVRKGAVQIVKYGSWQGAKDIGFDAWMRERTDRAHAAYMAGHAAGGIDYAAKQRAEPGSPAPTELTLAIGRLNGAPIKEVVAGSETWKSIKAYKLWLQGAGYRPCDHDYQQDRFGPAGQYICLYCRDIKTQ